MNSVTVVDEYRRVTMKQKYKVTQQFISRKGKDHLTSE
jgi:hypothetical protein